MIESPESRITNAEPTPQTVTTVNAPRWYQRRPIPVWIVFVWAALQMLAVFIAMSKAQYLEQINQGLISPVHAFIGLLFPLLFFLGGCSLFLMRKVSVIFFGAYFAWGIVKIGVSAPYISYLSLAIVAGICVYSLRLASQGRLR